MQDSFSHGEQPWHGLHCGSDGDGTRSKETTRWLAILSGVCLLLMALVIWLATEVTDNRHAISQLRSQIQQALDNDASVIASLNATSGVRAPRFPTPAPVQLSGQTVGSLVSLTLSRRIPLAQSVLKDRTLLQLILSRDG